MSLYVRWRTPLRFTVRSTFHTLFSPSGNSYFCNFMSQIQLSLILLMFYQMWSGRGKTVWLIVKVRGNVKNIFSCWHSNNNYTNLDIMCFVQCFIFYLFERAKWQDLCAECSLSNHDKIMERRGEWNKKSRFFWSSFLKSNPKAHIYKLT